MDTSSETWLNMFGIGGGKGGSARAGSEPAETEDAFGVRHFNRDYDRLHRGDNDHSICITSIIDGLSLQLCLQRSLFSHWERFSKGSGWIFGYFGIGF